MTGLRKCLGGLAVPIALLTLAACESQTPTAVPDVTSTSPRFELADLSIPETPENVQVWNNIFKLCKVGPTEYVPSFKVVEIRYPGTPMEVRTERTVQVAPGTCKVIGRNSDDPIFQVTELPEPGYKVDFVDLRTIGVLKEEEFGAVNTYEKDSIVHSNFVEVLIGRTPDGIYPLYSHAGAVAIYHNIPDTPPPPPVTAGSQGCTPGYWKQSQHFDSWIGYEPDQLFSSVFEDAFPGMTLVQVAGQGGGGLNALGRHVVAALLSSASSGVDYGMAPVNVIDAFNSVYSGSGGDYETLKNTLAARNERNCPLN